MTFLVASPNARRERVGRNPVAESPSVSMTASSVSSDPASNPRISPLNTQSNTRFTIVRCSSDDVLPSSSMSPRSSSSLSSPAPSSPMTRSRADAFAAHVARSSTKHGRAVSAHSIPFLPTSMSHESRVARTVAARLAPSNKHVSPKHAPGFNLPARSNTPPSTSFCAPGFFTNDSSDPLRTTYAVAPGKPCWQNTSPALASTRRVDRAAIAARSDAMSERSGLATPRTCAFSRSSNSPFRFRRVVGSAEDESSTAASSDAPAAAAKNAPAPPPKSLSRMILRLHSARTVDPTLTHVRQPVAK